jgi:hypothetical protein
MKNSLKIASIDVSRQGPFNSKYVFHFNPTITFIVGDHGTGKSTLAAAIKDELVRELIEAWDTMFNPDAIHCMLDDDCYQFPSIGKSWKLGQVICSDLMKNGIMPAPLVSRFQFFLRQIMSEKISCPSKFSGIVLSPTDLFASISDDFRIDIRHSITGQDLNWGFQALGERTVLFIALVSALRELLPLERKLPFVWDDFGGTLDRTLLPSCFNALRNLQGQVILLMHRGVADILGLQADIDLSWKELSNGNYLHIRQTTMLRI